MSFAAGISHATCTSMSPPRGYMSSAPTRSVSSWALPVIAVLSASTMARRKLLIGLMVWFAVANGLSAFAPTYHWMLLFRFLSGLPHGAYFGIAALVAASLMPADRRTLAVGRVLLGLTVATIVGVPLANWMGQAVGWRFTFGIVAALAIACAAMVAACLPLQLPGIGAGRESAACVSSARWRAGASVAHTL